MNSSVIKILYDPELQLPVATTKARSILLSNANPVLAHGLQYILQSDQYLSNFNITVATNTDLEALVKISPDIVIIDAWQGAANWHKVAHHFEAFSRISSLICYCTDITSAEARAISAIGFRGVMPTSISPEELVRAVCAVAFGGTYIHDLYRKYPDPSPAPSVALRKASDEVLAELTPREEEVLRHLALGSSMKEIAAVLNISTKTVDTYRTRANLKLNHRTRADIVRFAIKSGWME